MAFDWNDAAIAQLKSLMMEGLSFSQIGALLGCSRSAACGKAFRLGLSDSARRGRPKIVLGESAQVRGRTRQRLTNRGTRFTMETITEYEQPVMAAGDIEPLNIALLDLEPHHCRWPLGDGPFVFCGHQKYPGSSYCRAHFELSCGPGSYAERQALPVKRKAA